MPNAPESAMKSAGTHGRGCRRAASAVALQPGTAAAGAGAATTRPEAAAGKSRGKTTLNWVIAWKFKWLHKCVAAVAAGAHGATLEEFSSLVSHPVQTGGGCAQHPNIPENETLVRSTGCASTAV